jgi:hypothetical protein
MHSQISCCESFATTPFANHAAPQCLRVGQAPSGDLGGASLLGCSTSVNACPHPRRCGDQYMHACIRAFVSAARNRRCRVRAPLSHRVCVSVRLSQHSWSMQAIDAACSRRAARGPRLRLPSGSAFGWACQRTPLIFEVRQECTLPSNILPADVISEHCSVVRYVHG